MDKKSEFQYMVKAEMPKVYNLAYRLCGDFHQAKDITQETFLKAYQSFEKFEGRSQMFTYLYRITCNVWKNTLRKKRFKTFTSYSPENSSGEFDPPARDPSPYDEMQRSDRCRIVQKCLDSLPPAEKAIIILRDMEDRSYEEISSILNCRLGTVKSRLARARKSLADRVLPFMEVMEK
ncbi:MAG TPA: RNA polymerase sigma factor [bacterium]|nr:RNA polymerase sigma factor [bacterium]